MKLWDDEYTRNLATCAVCGKGFTPAEWEDRHLHDGRWEVHDYCCLDCAGVLVAGPDEEDEDENTDI